MYYNQSYHFFILHNFQKLTFFFVQDYVRVLKWLARATWKCSS